MANNVLPTKQTPAAVEAEIAVIGSIFMEPSSLIVARDFVTSEDFYDMSDIQFLPAQVSELMIFA